MALAIRYLCKVHGRVLTPAWKGSTPHCPKCAAQLAVEEGSGRIDGKPIIWRPR